MGAVIGVEPTTTGNKQGSIADKGIIYQSMAAIGKVYATAINIGGVVDKCIVDKFLLILVKVSGSTQLGGIIYKGIAHKIMTARYHIQSSSTRCSSFVKIKGIVLRISVAVCCIVRATGIERGIGIQLIGLYGVIA